MAKVRITPKQVLYLSIFLVVAAAGVLWVFFPSAIPFVDKYWRSLGKPSIGRRALYPFILALIGFAIASKRY